MGQKGRRQFASQVAIVKQMWENRYLRMYDTSPCIQSKLKGKDYYKGKMRKGTTPRMNCVDDKVGSV